MTFQRPIERRRLLLLVMACLVFRAAATTAMGSSDDDSRFFEMQVRPVLAEHCWKCHGPKVQKGGLRLDSLGSMLSGGDSGPAVVAGDPKKSLLLSAVRRESLEMPPEAPLTQTDVEALEQWIRRGAKWPADDGVVRKLKTDRFSADDRSWWAFQPVVDPEVPSPEPSDWARNDLDRFILARLQTEGLSPAPEADRVALIRRATFDLTGLPPTPEEVDDFLADKSPRAYERLVDRLLASPHYGERWARHWLDLVRYADSDGYRIDHYRPNAWRYRDYVIASFNEDKPYDWFVQEQIAGDELFPGDPQALVATGFLQHGIYEYNNRDAVGQWHTILDEITDATGDVFLGVGIQCARCHDHKYDPILQKDYYRLRAFFAAIAPNEHGSIATPSQKAAYDAALQPWLSHTEKLREQSSRLEEPYRQKAQRDAISKFPPDVQRMIHKPAAERTPLEHQVAQLAWRQVDYEFSRLDGAFRGKEKEKILALRRELAKFDRERPRELPDARTTTDVGRTAPPTIIPKKGVAVEPGFLTILDEKPAAVAPIGNSTGRRAALARWIADPKNPLSTRVAAHRVWQRHFGNGLAPSSSDFGKLGGRPSHPELLDWLTARFLEGGWRLKSLHRLIVTSATYRQSSTHPEAIAYQKKDPTNRWHWRADVRRLDAEQIRDAILASTGLLDPTAGGPGVPADQPRRSIYTRTMRNSRDLLLDAFDLPLFFNSAASRDSTTSPVQSLLLINSPEMLRYAAALAKAAGESGDAPGSIRRAWRLAWGRDPTATELAEAQQFLRDQSQRIAADRRLTEAKPRTSKMPFRDGQSLLFASDDRQAGPAARHDQRLDAADFTVEAFFQVRSIYDTGEVRTIAGKWNGDPHLPGWSFGVTGKGSRRKPQTLVLQLCGTTTQGKFAEAALFSDQHIELNKPYYAAASVRLAGEKPGVVEFYLKDLSNDDEPLLRAAAKHSIAGGFANRQPMTVGRQNRAGACLFDGLIDDVRLSSKALSAGELLLTAESVRPDTLGYWQFESHPGIYRDSSPAGIHLEAAASQERVDDPMQAAMVDLCHVLLNSNQFLYVP